jgi:hypothetical protein
MAKKTAMLDLKGATYSLSGGMYVIKIKSGNYTNDTLIELLENILGQLDIKCGINEDGMFTMESDSLFSFMGDGAVYDNNIAGVLGVIEGCQKEKKCVGTVVMNVRPIEYVSLTLKNVSESVFTKLSVGEKKISGVGVMDVPIKELCYLEMSFTPENMRGNVILHFKLKGDITPKKLKTVGDEGEFNVHEYLENLMNQ